MSGINPRDPSDRRGQGNPGFFTPLENEVLYRGLLHDFVQKEKFGLPHKAGQILIAFGPCGLSLSLEADFSVEKSGIKRSESLVPLKKSIALLTWKRWGVRVLALGVFVLSFGGLNSLATRYNHRFDWTRSQQHTLTTTTRKILEGLNKEISITALYVGIPPQYLEDLFKEYERLSRGKISTEIIDPLVEIGYAARFGQVIKGDENKAIVIFGKERIDIDFTEKPLSEPYLTNALVKVTRPPRKIYFLSGHGEYDIEEEGEAGLRTLNILFESNNWETEKLLLEKTGEIPQDTDLLMVAGPRHPLSPNEKEALQRYLESGGKVFILVESAPIESLESAQVEGEDLKNPDLNDLLNPWGVRVGNDVVIDLENHVSGDVGCPVTNNYPPHRSIVGGLDYTFYIRPRSITLIEPSRPTIKTAPLVLTVSATNSWTETDKTFRVIYDEGKDTMGPVALAAVVWEPADELQGSDTRLIVFTDADFLTNAYLPSYSHAQLVLNAVYWLTDLPEVPVDTLAESHVERLDLTSRQLKRMAVILVLMPVLIAVGGIVGGIRSLG